MWLFLPGARILWSYIIVFLSWSINETQQTDPQASSNSRPRRNAQYNSSLSTDDINDAIVRLDKKMEVLEENLSLGFDTLSSTLHMLNDKIDDPRSQSTQKLLPLNPRPRINLLLEDNVQSLMEVNKELNIKNIAAMNRGFALGMLYDVRSDQLIPGIKLWDATSIRNGTKRHIQSSEQGQITATQGIVGKSNLFNIEAKLQLSFYAGLITVSGAAKYLDESASSNLKESVTMSYQSQTIFEQLDVATLTQQNLDYQNIVEQTPATHVVVAIQYGANFFFIFENTNITTESTIDVEGSLQVQIDKFVHISGGASVNLSTTDTNLMNSLKITFHGDIIIPPPKNFWQAMEVYQNLSQLAGEGIPIRVSLLPIASFISNTAIFEREISENVETEFIRFYDDFNDIKDRANNLKNNRIFQNQVDDFHTLVEVQLLEIQNKVSKMLPQIRGGNQSETELTDIISEQLNSPYSFTNLQDWIEKKEMDLNIVRNTQKFLEGTRFVSKEDLQSIIVSPGYNEILVFMLKIPCTSRNQQLIDMKAYLNITMSDSCPEVINDAENYNASKLILRSRLFKDYKFRANTVTFYMSAESTTYDAVSGSIYQYVMGNIMSTDFIPPPPAPTVEPTPLTTTEPTPVTTTEPTPVPNCECPEGFFAICYNVLRCFKLFLDETRNWLEAQEKCLEEKLLFPSKTDGIALLLVAYIEVKVKGLFTHHDDITVWLNAQRRDNEIGQFQWELQEQKQDQKPPGYNESFGFMDPDIIQPFNPLWVPNQPPKHSSTKDCLVLGGNLRERSNERGLAGHVYGTHVCLDPHNIFTLCEAPGSTPRPGTTPSPVSTPKPDECASLSPPGFWIGSKSNTALGLLGHGPVQTCHLYGAVSTGIYRNGQTCCQKIIYI